MTAKHLLRFIKKKLKKNHTDIVVYHMLRS